MELVDTSWLTKKTKQPAVKLAKTVIAVNGMFATSLGIAGLIPQVQKYLVGSDTVTPITNINSTLLFGSILYLGVSNMASLLSLDVASTYLQLNSNVIGYGIYSVIGGYYYYKVSRNIDGLNGTLGYSKKFWYVTGAMTGVSLLSSMVAISRLKSTFTTTQLFTMKLRSGTKTRRNSGPKKVVVAEKKVDESGDTDGTYIRDTSASFCASGYKYCKIKEDIITLTQVTNADDMGGSESLGTVIDHCQNCQFKIECNKDQIGGKGSTPQQLEAFKNPQVFPITALTLQGCKGVSAQVSYVIGPVNLVDCENCQAFITHGVTAIDVSDCKRVKISIMKDALSIYEEWEYIYRDSNNDDTVTKSTKIIEITDGSIVVDGEPTNIVKLSVDESKNYIRYMNNKKCNEKYRLLKRNLNKPNISVTTTSGMELSINYYGNTKPLDIENEQWMDYNVPYRASATIDLANGKGNMKFDLL